MVIDFHAHAFPDKIAVPTIKMLAEKGGIPAYLNGTLQNLHQSMQQNGINICINLPVVTKIEQFDSINNFAMQVNNAYKDEEYKIISFAGIHPACQNIPEKMRFIKDSGFLGIKLHPDYQGTFFDDDGYFEILKQAKDLGLIVSVHAGIDGGFKGLPVKCPPQIAKKVINRLGGYEKLILAHMGGNHMVKEVNEYLAGEKVFFDTGYALNDNGHTDQEIMDTINAHGEDKILFATDSPWGDMRQNLARLNSLNLSTEAKNKILYKNAEKLLNI
ncbi:MAG: metal-dependent hydrolase [Clostridiales bacterium]|nr:metal-dependent hydrolase [Clostridiales bacterium]